MSEPDEAGEDDGPARTRARDVVCSFYVRRRKKDLARDCGPLREPPPSPEQYVAMLQILDRSCKRWGLEHVVLTDDATASLVAEAGLVPFMAELPRALMQATTEIQARWLESPHSIGCNTTFVGADCIIARDFRPHLPACDLAIAYMQDHKRWRLNNGFMHVPASSRTKAAPVFRLIADDTGPRMFEDMLAIERALSPISGEPGLIVRRGLSVAMLPVNRWNLSPEHCPDEPIVRAFVLHFMGGWASGKKLFFDHAKALDLA